MDMEYYRNFIAIVEAGSLSAASKRVHVAQPALSNQLKLLQKKFGTQLVNIRRGVSLRQLRRRSFRQCTA